MGLDLALRGAPLQLSDFGRPLTPDEQLAAEQTRAEMTSTPGRAWKSAGLGAKVASLWDAANAAYIDNDLERAQQLEAQAKEYGQRAGIMAVPIQETKDINGVGDAVDYATGHLVSGVRSTLPVIGASMAGGFLGGPVGAGLGALGAGYGLGREQSLSQSMQDEAIRNTRSYQDMRNTAHLQGLAEGALDALVPAAMTGKVFRGFTAKGLGPAFPQMMNYAEKRAWLEGQKTAARELAESGLGGAARHFGKNVAEGFGGEFITGGAQDVSGQMFQNELRGDPVGGVDWRQAFESALAEGVGGTGFGAIGGGAEIIGAHRANPDVGLIGGYDLGEKAVGASYDTLKGALSAAYETAKEYAPAIYAETGKTMSFIYKEMAEVTKALYPVLKEDTANIIRTVSPDVWGLVKTLGYDVADVAKVLGKDGLAALSTVARDLTPEELRTEIDAAMKRVGDAAVEGVGQELAQREVLDALRQGYGEEGTGLPGKIGAAVRGLGKGGEALWNEGEKAVGHLWDKTGAVARDVGDWYMSRLKTANIDRDDTTNMLRQAASLLIDPNTALQRKGRSEKAASFDSVAASNETTVATLPLMRKLIDDVGLNNEHPLVARFAELEAKAKAAGSPQSLRQADRTTLGKLVNEFSDLMDDKRAISRLTEGDEQVPHSRAKRSENKELDLFFREDVRAITQELFANTSLGKSPEQINEAVDGVVRMIDGIANKRSTKAKPGERSVNYTDRAKAFAEYLAGTFGRDAVENFFYKLEEMADVRYGPESVQGLRLARSRGRDTANFVEKMTTPGKNGRPLINPDAWDDTGDDSPSARARRGNRLIRDLLQVVRDAREAEARPLLSDEEVLSRTSAADGKVAAYLNRREALADAGKRKYLNDFMQALVQRGVIQEENVQRVLSELEAYEDSGEEGPNKHDPVPDADQAASRVVELEDDNDYEEQQGAFEYEYDSEVDRGKDERLQHLKDQTYSHTGASERFSGLTWHGAESMSGEQTGKALKSGGVPTPVNRYNLTSTKEKDRFLNETQVLGAELRSRYGPRTTSQEFVRVVDWAEERHATHGDNEFTLLRAARDKVLEYDAEKQKRLLEKLAKTTDVNDKAAINKEIAAIDERKEYAKTNSPALFFDKYSAYGYYRLAQNPGENLKFTLKDLIRNSVREDEKMSEYVTRQARRDKAVATPFADEVYKKSIIPVQTTGTRKLRLDLPRLVKSAMGAHQQGDVEGNTDHARNPRSSGPLTPTEGFSENYRKGILNAVTAVLKEIQLTPDVAENPFGDKFIQSQMAMAHGNKQTMYNELDPDVVVWRDAESGTYFTYGELRGVLKDKDGNIRTENRRFVKALVPQNTTDSRGRTLTENVTKITSQVWTPGSMTAETLAKIAIPNDKPRKTEALDPSRGIYTNGLVKPGEPGKFWHLNARGLLSHMLTRAGHDASALMQEGLPEKLAVRLMWEGIQELREQGYELREASSDLATKITLYRDGEWLNEDGERVPREVKLGDMLGAIHPNSPNTTSHDIETVKHEELKGGLDGLRKKMGFTTKEDDGEYKKYKDKEARGEALDDSEVIEKKAIETKMDFEKFVAVSLQRRVLKMARERLADSLEQQFSHAKKEADKTYERTLKNNKAGKTDLGTKGVNRTLAIELTILDRTENSAVAKTLAQYDNEIAKLDKKIAAWVAKEKMSVEQADKLVRDLDKDLRKQERLENDSGWATGEPTDGTERALRYDPMEMENIRINEIVRELKALSGGDPALFDLAAEFGRSFAPKNEYAANSKLREVAKHIELLKNHLEKKMIGKKSPDHNAEVSRLKDQISTAERAEEALLSQQTAVLDKINDGIESLFAERGGTEADLASYEADLKIIRDRQKTLLADNNMDAKEKTKRLNFLGKDAAHTSARIVSLRERLAKIGAREEMDSGARKAARQSLTHNPSTTKAASVGRDLQRAMDEKARLEKDEASLTDSIAELKALINGHADHTKLDHLTSSEKKLDTATRLRRQKVNRQAHLKSLEKRLADPARKEAVQQQLNEADANIARLQKELQAAEARAQKTPQAALAVDPRTIKPVTGDKQAERAAQKTAEDKSKGQWKHLVSEARTFVWNERKRLVKEGLLDESVLGEDGKQLNLPDHEVVTLYQDFMEKWDTQYAESLQDEAPQTEVPQTEAAQQPMTVEKIMEQVMSGKFKDAVQREVLPTLSEADTWKLYEKLKQANRRPGTDRAATLGVLDVMGYNELSYASWLAKQEVPFSKAKRKQVKFDRMKRLKLHLETDQKTFQAAKELYGEEGATRFADVAERFFKAARSYEPGARKYTISSERAKNIRRLSDHIISKAPEEGSIYRNPFYGTPAGYGRIGEIVQYALFDNKRELGKLGRYLTVGVIHPNDDGKGVGSLWVEVWPKDVVDRLTLKAFDPATGRTDKRKIYDLAIKHGAALTVAFVFDGKKGVSGPNLIGPDYNSDYYRKLEIWGKAKIAKGKGGVTALWDDGTPMTTITGVTQEQIDQLIADAHARFRILTNQEFVGMRWGRITGATGDKDALGNIFGRKGMALLSRAKSPDADAKPSEDYQPGEEFKRIIGETFGFKLVGKEDWAAKWTLDDKGQLKDVLMSFYGLNEAESIGMERHEAWHGVEQLLEGMGDVGKQILDDITSWADSEHARAWLAKKLEPYPDALADIDDTKNPKLAAKERKAYAFQFFMEEGKMPPGKAQGWFNKIKEAIRKFFNWTGLKTTSDLQRAEAFFKYVGEGNFLRDAENPASVLEGLGKTKTDKFVEDVKGAIKPISDAVDVLFAHTADRVKGMKIAAYTELLKIYEGESGKGGYMLAQRTQFNRHANMFIHMRKGKDEKALPGVVREFKEKFRGYLSQALSAEDIQNLYDKVNTFNHDAINDNMEAFLNDLRLYGGLKDKTPGELRNIASDIANKGYYYDENAPIRLFEKKPEIMEKWKERSPNGEIYRLVRIGTRMVERNRFFGKNDERLHNLLAQGNHEASAEQQELMRKVVDAFEGRLGGDLSPGMRTLFNALTTANNIRLLPMAVFSQMIDPVRLAARKNDFASSLDPLFKGIKDMPRAWFDNAEKQGAKDTWEKLAEETGILANLALGNMMSELNLGYRMGGKLGWLNDKFFKYNFMEQWERSMTVSATKMGVEFLREHSTSKTAQSKRYLDELGLDSGDVKFDKDGALITDEKVSAALAQYVAESLAHPDAGSNPLWMNDQRFALMSHLKRFSFAHQRYVLDRGVREYKLGNASILAPAVMAVPWMLTVDALRDAINPFSSTGYKADWGAADYLTSGMDRAGHTGKWQMPHDVMRNLTHGGDPFSPVLGPTADAFGRIVRKTRKGDGVEAMIDAIPGSSLFRPM